MSEHDYVKVGDVMSISIIKIDRMATVEEAIKIMGEKRVSSLVVERRNEADEFGLLTISDVANKVVAEEKAAARTNVYEIMSKPVLTIARDMNIKYAIRLLAKFDLSRALVVDESRAPMGIVTLRDMVLRHAS